MKSWVSAQRRPDTPIRCRKCLDSGIVDGVYTGPCECATGLAYRVWLTENPDASPYDFPAPDWIYTF